MRTALVLKGDQWFIMTESSDYFEVVVSKQICKVNTSKDSHIQHKEPENNVVRHQEEGRGTNFYRAQKRHQFWLSTYGVLLKTHNALRRDIPYYYM